ISAVQVVVGAAAGDRVALRATDGVFEPPGSVDLRRAVDVVRLTGSAGRGGARHRWGVPEVRRERAGLAAEVQRIHEVGAVDEERAGERSVRTVGDTGPGERVDRDPAR